MRNLTFDEVVEYESLSCSLIRSFLYMASGSYFLWVCKRKYKRYIEVKDYSKKFNIHL